MNMSVHPEKISPHLRHLIQAEDGNGPITRQFCASREEDVLMPDERDDPIGDEAHSPLPGLIHRYPDRVLLLPTQDCASHCRFCFRRTRPQKSAIMNDEALKDALAYIRTHAEIREVVLSGGDPLTLPPEKLSRLLTSLDSISHLIFLRIHTRMPITNPKAITKKRLSALTTKNHPLWMVLHVNHSSELTPECLDSCRKMQTMGIPLLAQTVLLRGINDDTDTLATLFRTMAANRIQPYYLHHPDLVPGTSHFRVSLKRGREIYAALRGKLSGFCIPHYVLDLPGGHGKVSIATDAIETLKGENTATIRDRSGRIHEYPGHSS
ncbi:MAG TPA: lysine 2,3-aminomutase [Rhodospirillaceae bacterium]|nr:MAG: hypothetical protein A2018_04820 [Alphaproteobacteria bacterium GWF2_58_20]HAU28840.1 lysine 2,3-aminomutase [Rhodospirillaceae bacterium]